MKKTGLLSVLALLMVGGVCQHATAQQTKYWVVCGWMEKSGEDSRPYVTNVVSVSCNYQSESMVKTQFYDFFNAFVAKRSGYDSASKNCLAWSFDTYDKAELKRRELIADYNKRWNTYLINSYSVLCRD